LQFLPALPPENREGAGKAYLARYGTMFESPVQADILTQVMAILSHPDFAPLFGPHSLAEAPISGFTPDGRLISGQIDRLLIGEHDILIADYKTGRNPPG
ncbi:MAG TPA: hypothetical protein PLO23_09900, partial [Alphaproteobacteria bacterium]|nr:hypothetical protein [Alphaproteobacteria bacterium]